MVAEWETALTKFADFTPHLTHGTSSWSRASDQAARRGEPCGRILILITDSIYQWFNQVEADGWILLGPGMFSWVVMDEAHRLRTSRTPSGKFGMANGSMVKMDSHNYSVYMAFYILSLELHYPWMLMATPVVNRIEDLRWILHYLERLSWLTLQLPPEKSNFTNTFDDHWVMEGSSVSGIEPGAGRIPGTD